MAGRGDRYERDRFYEQDRYEDDRYYMRGGRGPPGRDRAYDDEIIRDRTYVDYETEPRRERRRDHDEDFDRKVVIERDRERDYYRSPSPRGRPAFLRRQSSLDTFDRRPLRQFYDREEYPPPARREDIRRDDFRSPPYQEIPLPRTKALPPARRSGERFYYEEDDYYNLPPERVYEREIVRSRDRRERSRDSHTTRTSKSRTHRSSSKSSTTQTRSSSSSSSSGGTTIRSEYPKKGKTRVPARLVSKRALIDMEYPFVEEGNVIIIQKALGQENIDQLLKLSEDYKRSEEEVAAARSSAGDLEERRDDPIPPPPPLSAAPSPAPIVIPPPAPQTPVVIDAGPPRASAQFYEYDRTVYRDTSPSHSSHHHPHDSGAIIARSRSRSRSGREIRAEIKSLERQLAHRPKGELTERFTERLPNGELVVYEESVENIKSPPKPPRLEKDKKGRMSISVPKYR